MCMTKAENTITGPFRQVGEVAAKERGLAVKKPGFCRLACLRVCLFFDQSIYLYLFLILLLPLPPRRPSASLHA